MLKGMIKNYIIGILSGYVLVQLPFWRFDNAIQPAFIVAAFGFWLAWAIRSAEEDIKTEREKNKNGNEDQPA